jgi:hypothetical protein
MALTTLPQMDGTTCVYTWEKVVDPTLADATTCALIAGRNDRRGLQQLKVDATLLTDLINGGEWCLPRDQIPMYPFTVLGKRGVVGSDGYGTSDLNVALAAVLQQMAVGVYNTASRSAIDSGTLVTIILLTALAADYNTLLMSDQDEPQLTTPAIRMHFSVIVDLVAEIRQYTIRVGTADKERLQYQSNISALIADISSAALSKPWIVWLNSVRAWHVHELSQIRVSMLTAAIQNAPDRTTEQYAMFQEIVEIADKAGFTTPMTHKAAIWVQAGMVSPGYITVEVTKIYNGTPYVKPTQSIADIIRDKTSYAVLKDYIPDLIPLHK